MLKLEAPLRDGAVKAPRSSSKKLALRATRLRRRPSEAELISQHLPLVKTVVGRLQMSLPSHVDPEDLYSAGMIGLLDAIRHYNPQLGSSFETYARVRIRGAVIDELRRMDWVPRSIHTKARRVQEAMQAIEQRKKRPPTDAEVAAALCIPLAEYYRWIEEIRPATFVCLDSASNPENADSPSQYECLADFTQENPFEAVSRREMAAVIAQRLEHLPPMQRKVLALYYFEDLRLREIAEAFDLTESRICQIHSQAILALKAQLRHLDTHRN